MAHQHLHPNGWEDKENSQHRCGDSTCHLAIESIRTFGFPEGNEPLVRDMLCFEDIGDNLNKTGFDVHRQTLFLFEVVLQAYCPS